MNFKERFKELREEQGLTQADIAKILDVPRTTVASWETGKGVPNLDMLKKICKFFEVTSDYLIGLKE
jgi:DNA-binding XRE family transcriptional regulator